MSELEKPQINLTEQPTMFCSNCGCEYFKEVVMLKNVPALLTGSPEDTIVPFPTYMCIRCDNVNDEFKIFDEPSKINE